MSDLQSCPSCGAPLEPNAPETLCPACLINNAAWSQTIPLPEDSALAPTLPGGSEPPVGEPPTAPPSPGAEFGGYRIVRRLGRGGMGTVYEAEQIESGRRVALKVLSHKLDTQDARQRFIREGRLAASINHPNSVYVFGTEEIDGMPAITMEIVPGGTLQEHVARNGPLAVPRAVDTILQIIAGLEAAQAIGILHRDVKPSNCFLDDRGVAKIGDFGLSISTEGHGDSHLTLQGSLLGTPAFSAPEQLRGDELNARSDMYSVGATLFYLLTGHAPFESDNMMKLLARVLEEAPPDPRALRPELPRSLAAIILRCLNKSPADRFKSYAELGKALRPYGSESPTPATLALRLGAYLIDFVILMFVGFLVQLAAWGGFRGYFEEGNAGTTKARLLLLGINLGMVGYYGVLEGRWGASLGKRMVRLRLVGPGGGASGVGRATLRAASLVAVLTAPHWIASAINPEWVTADQGWLAQVLLGFANLLVLGLIFSFARRRNGFAGLHGLVSGTRVVHAPAVSKRPALALPEEVARSGPPEDAERIGPYHVIESLGRGPDGEWLLA